MNAKQKRKGEIDAYSRTRNSNVHFSFVSSRQEISRDGGKDH